METLSPAQKLDAVLNLLKIEPLTINALQTRLSGSGIAADEYPQITCKLQKDDLIEKNAENQYIANFNGRLFIGYNNQKELEAINQIIAENNDSVRLRTYRMMVKGVWFAGTAILLLLLWQIFVYLFPVSSN
jgi:hypothetical protein